MKFLVFVAVIAMSMSANAARLKKSNKKLTSPSKITSTYKYEAPSSTSEGLRVSLVAPLLVAKVKASGYGMTTEGDTELDQNIGLSVGYASLPVQSLGFLANLTAIRLDFDGSGEGYARLDGSAAYMINDLLGLYGGINLGSFMDKQIREVFKPGLGFQLGTLLQFNETLGMHLGYTQMNNSAAYEGIKADLVIQGVELGVSATF